MRILAILLAALVIALGPPAALAKSAKTPPGQATSADTPAPSGKGRQSYGAEPPGQAAKADRSEPPGQAGRNHKPVPPGQAKDDTTGTIPPGPEAAPPTRPSAAGEINEAKRVVLQHEALPLARIVALAESRTAGRVINARLLRVDGVLLYQLTLLDDAGRSWRDYYSARTGNPVIIP